MFDLVFSDKRESGFIAHVKSFISGLGSHDDPQDLIKKLFQVTAQLIVLREQQLQSLVPYHEAIAAFTEVSKAEYNDYFKSADYRGKRSEYVRLRDEDKAQGLALTKLELELAHLNQRLHKLGESEYLKAISDFATTHKLEHAKVVGFLDIVDSLSQLAEARAIVSKQADALEINRLSEPHVSFFRSAQPHNHWKTEMYFGESRLGVNAFRLAKAAAAAARGYKIDTDLSSVFTKIPTDVDVGALDQKHMALDGSGRRSKIPFGLLRMRMHFLVRDGTNEDGGEAVASSILTAIRGGSIVKTGPGAGPLVDEIGQPVDREDIHSISKQAFSWTGGFYEEALKRMLATGIQNVADVLPKNMPQTLMRPSAG